jgi:hypothetical protein
MWAAACANDFCSGATSQDIVSTGDTPQRKYEQATIQFDEAEP